MRRLLLAAAAASLLAAPVSTAHAQRITPPAADTVAPPIGPWGAFWRSLVVPGWGQAELGAETRGAVYFVAEGFSVWMWARAQRRLDHVRRSLPEDDPLVESRKQQREDWITLAVFLAFFNAADAWVTAHLYGFETKAIPVPQESALLLGVSIPVGSTGR